MSTRLLHGDCREVLKTLPSESVHCVVTSPPYFGLRDYGTAGQIGLEATPDAYVAEIVAVFREVRRVLRNDGTCWINLGDGYVSKPPGNKSPPPDVDGVYKRRMERQLGHGEDASLIYAKANSPGLKPKDLIGIPWMVAFALRADGWYLRQDIIWSKPNPMPESVRDRCTKAHEYLFLLSKSPRYFWDAQAIAEATTFPVDVTRKPSGDYSQGSGRNDGGEHRSGGFVNGATRNRRSVWEVATQPFSEAHFATFPPALIEPCILAGCSRNGVVLDPFSGAGTTGLVADRLGRNAILIELNAGYADMSKRRITDDAPLFAEVVAA